MRKSSRLPTRFPPGSKYVLERRGLIVHRYIELPNGRRVALPVRKALTCCCATEASLVPQLSSEKQARTKPARPQVSA